MARTLAIDYGRKRCGLAVTDRLGIVPNVLETVRTHTLMDYLQVYCQREPVSTIVVGYPRQADGTDSESMREIRPFLKKLEAAFPDMLIELEDERFTSVMAQQTILDAGLNKTKRQEKGLVDAVSAVIILQSYLERHSAPVMPEDMLDPPNSTRRSDKRRKR